MSGNSGDAQGGRRLAMPTEGALYLWLRISRRIARDTADTRSTRHGALPTRQRERRVKSNFNAEDASLTLLQARTLQQEEGGVPPAPAARPGHARKEI